MDTLENAELLDNDIYVSGIGCRLWRTRENNTIFATARSQYYSAAALMPGFEMGITEEGDRYCLSKSKCPVCGSPMKVDDSQAQYEYVIYCEHCQKAFRGKKRPTENEVINTILQRESVPALDKNTVLINLLSCDVNEFDNVLASYYYPHTEQGYPTAAKAYGVFCRYEDALQNLLLPEDFHEFRIASGYHSFSEAAAYSSSSPVLIMKLNSKKAGTDCKIPFSGLYGKDMVPFPPYDGSGYFDIHSQKIPVWECKDGLSISNAFIYIHYPDGTEENVAVYRWLSKKFTPIQSGSSLFHL